MTPRRRWGGVLITLGVAVGSVLLGTTLLEEYVALRLTFFTLTFAAAILTAYVGGVWPGLAAAAIGAVFAVYQSVALGVFDTVNERALWAGARIVIVFAAALLAGLLSDRTRRASAAEHALREELEEKVDALRSANESLEAFTFVVSHDLKEPVRALDAAAEELAHELGPLLTPDQAVLVDAQRDASRRLGLLVDGLLDLSRAERTRHMEHAAVRVREALAAPACRARFDDLLRERGGRLDVEDQGPSVHAPPTAMHQILGNLVVNALRHNPRPRPHVLVRAGPVDGQVEVVVEDDGPGFRPDVLAWFNEGREGGTPGFGLLIVRRAVEHLGGRVWAESSPAGARVHMTLPQA